MATFATLDEVKRQCNVEHDEDDKVLKDMLDVAENYIEKTIQQPLTDVCVNGVLPKMLKQAILIYAATLYANREEVAFSGQPTPIPYANVQTLITPFIKYR